MTTSKRMKPPTHRQGNPIELLVIVLLVGVGLFYTVNALSTGDWGWFMPNDSFDAKPMRIELYHEGENTIFHPGEGRYNELTAALNEQLRAPVANWPNGLRPDVVAEARDKHMTLIFVYAAPVRIHTQWNIGSPTRFLIPVTGAFSSEERVYVGSEGGYGSGAIVVKDLEPLREIARAAAAP